MLAPGGARAAWSGQRIVLLAEASGEASGEDACRGATATIRYTLR